MQKYNFKKPFSFFTVHHYRFIGKLPNPDFKIERLNNAKLTVFGEYHQLSFTPRHWGLEGDKVSTLITYDSFNNKTEKLIAKLGALQKIVIEPTSTCRQKGLGTLFTSIQMQYMSTMDPIER